MDYVYIYFFFSYLWSRYDNSLLLARKRTKEIAKQTFFIYNIYNLKEEEERKKERNRNVGGSMYPNAVQMTKIRVSDQLSNPNSVNE